MEEANLSIGKRVRNAELVVVSFLVTVANRHPVDTCERSQ